MVTQNKLEQLPPPNPERRTPDDKLNHEQLLVHTENLSLQHKRAIGLAAFNAEVAKRRTKALEDAKNDVKVLAEENERLHYEATHDSLTGLHNHRVVDEDGEATAFFERHKGKPAYAAVLDINGMKSINDVYGHKPDGDTVIELFARACKESIRFSGETEEVSGGDREGDGLYAKDYAVRTGGDEVFFVGLGDEETGRMIMERIAKRFGELQRTEASHLPVRTCSYGVIEFDDGDLCEAREKADAAALKAKDQYYKESGKIRRR